MTHCGYFDTAQKGNHSAFQQAIDGVRTLLLSPLKGGSKATFSFFYRASYGSTVLAVIMCLSVCLSVRLFVTSRSRTKMAKRRITLTTSYDSPWTLVFRCQKSWRNSNQITPTGAPNRGGVDSNRQFSTNISLYLRNGASYHGRLIGTRVRSIRWCYIQ